MTRLFFLAVLCLAGCATPGTKTYRYTPPKFHYEQFEPRFSGTVPQNSAAAAGVTNSR